MKNATRVQIRPKLAHVGLAALAMLIPTGTTFGQTVLANYPLTSSLADTTGVHLPMILNGAATGPSASGACVNGVYDFAPGGSDARTDDIVSLNIGDFQLDVDFNMATLTTAPPGFGGPVLIGGWGWRWIGILVQADGTIGVLSNNSITNWSTTQIQTGTWYSATLKFENGIVQLLLDGAKILEANVGQLTHGGDLHFTTNNYSNGGNLDGCIRNLVVSNDTTLCSISTYGDGCPHGGFIAFQPKLSIAGCSQVGQQITIEVTDGKPLAPAILLLGLGQASAPLGSGCSLLVAPLLAQLPPIPLSGGAPGTGQMSLPSGPLPVSGLGVTLTLQCFVIDSSVGIGAAATNGVQFTIDP